LGAFLKRKLRKARKDLGKSTLSREKRTESIWQGREKEEDPGQKRRGGTIADGGEASKKRKTIEKYMAPTEVNGRGATVKGTIDVPKEKGEGGGAVKEEHRELK